MSIGLARLSRCAPNIFTSPSEASRKAAVSTPSLVTSTSANDCMHEKSVKEMVNEIEDVTLTVSKYGVTVVISSYLFLSAVVLSLG